VTDTEIVEALRGALDMPVGRHLYGVPGSYRGLARFAEVLAQASTLDGQRFPAPVSVNRGILEAIPEGEFKELVQAEVRVPEVVARHVRQAFEQFLRERLMGEGLVVLHELELLFAYGVDLSALRTLTTDANRALLLLPGRRESGQILLYPEAEMGAYSLPTNLIAENHLWELEG
jgi:hypothetical protein